MGSLRRPSVVRPHFQTTFSSETTGPNVTKFHMYYPGTGGNEKYKNGFDPKFKMAAMLKYDKNPLKIFFSRTTWRIRLIFWQEAYWAPFYKKQLKSFRSDHKQTLSGWGKVGKK